MEKIHAVLRLDNMSGTQNGARLKSVKFYDGGAPAAIDNGQLVVLEEAIGREVYKAVAPKADSVADDIYLVGGVELFYDETVKHYLTEWENAADKPVRVYKPEAGADGFSVTAEAFEGVPAVGKYVGFAAGSTKIQVQETRDEKTIGKIESKETSGWGKGAYEYFYIQTCAAKA